MRSRVVEFAGPPGSGKSTLLRAVDRLIRDEGGGGREPVPGGGRGRGGGRVYEAWLVARRGGRDGLCYFDTVRRSKPATWSDRRFLFKLTVRRLADMERSVNGPQKVMFQDEGPFQWAWSVSYRATSPNALSDSIDCVVGSRWCPRAVVMVLAPLEVIRNRIVRRDGTDRVDRDIAGEAVPASFIVKRFEAVRKVVRNRAARTGIDVHEVWNDGSTPPEEVARDILNRVDLSRVGREGAEPR